MNEYKSLLHEMALTTQTDFWNDSCSVEELTYAIEHGAVGATSNPTIVMDVLKKEFADWRQPLKKMIAENPTCSEDELSWMLFQAVTLRGADLMMPVFERHNGLKGRMSIQTDPRNYRNAAALTAQAIEFGSLRSNMQVKLPVTKAGIQAIEETTAAGVNINATVCFTVPQAVAVAEAVERGLEQRAALGKDISGMRPVCTIMVGRTDDWMSVTAQRDGILLTPGVTGWAGIACMKNAYGIFLERGYRTRLLGAAYRHHMHLTELVGGDIVLTIPGSWQKQLNAAGFPLRERMHEPVPQAALNELYERLPDFRRAYDVDGLTIDEFDTYGATVRTLRGFVGSVHELASTVRDAMLPNPDIR